MLPSSVLSAASLLRPPSYCPLPASLSPEILPIAAGLALGHSRCSQNLPPLPSIGRKVLDVGLSNAHIDRLGVAFMDQLAQAAATDSDHT